MARLAVQKVYVQIISEKISVKWKGDEKGFGVRAEDGRPIKPPAG